MRLTKNSLCKTVPFACDQLLWIGDTEHPAVRNAWDLCRLHCDTIAMRPSLRDAIDSPPRQSPTHVLIAQTNRHELETLAIDGPLLGELNARYPNSHRLVVRGPLVAPTVRLPPASSPFAITNAASPRNAAVDLPAVDSVSGDEAVSFLPFWFSADRRAPVSDVREVVAPVVIVAARYALAEGYLDSLAMFFPAAGGSGPLIQWQRTLTARSASGFATVLWDDSVASPTTPLADWQSRLAVATKSHHVWITDWATPRERQIARNGGIAAIVEKPARVECLLAQVRTNKIAI